MSPRQFIRQFKAVAGEHAAAVWPLLTPGDLAALNKGQDWGALEGFIALHASGSLFHARQEHDIPLPDCNCHDCKHKRARTESGTRCGLKQKNIPPNILPAGCKDWEPK